MKQMSLIVITTLVFITSSCRNGNDGSQIAANDSLSMVDTFVETKTSNDYSRVLDTMCGGTGDFSELIYTNRNTDFYPIDNSDSLKAFVVSTEVMCGATSGSCGRAISIIKREKGKYKTLGENCGKIDSVVSVGKKTLIYFATQDHYQRLWTYNGNAIQRSIARIYEWPYANLEAIAKNTSVAIENLIPEGVNTDNADAVNVSLQKSLVDTEAEVCVYHLLDGNIDKSFVFINRKNTQTLALNYTGKLKLDKKAEGYILRDEQQKKAWSYNAKKHSFIAASF